MSLKVILVLVFAFTSSLGILTTNETQNLVENFDVTNEVPLEKKDKHALDSVLKFIEADVHETKELNKISRNFFCETMKTCSECTRSKKKQCYWCHDFGCTENAQQFCPEAAYIESNEHTKCPYIKHSGEILVPSGIRRNINLDIIIPDPELYNKEIICQIKLKGKLTHSKGIIMKDTVYCYPVTLDLAENDNIKTGTISLIWGGAEPYSNELPIKIFKCESFATECEICKLIPKEYGCGWCFETGTCVTKGKCFRPRHWIRSNQNCNLDNLDDKQIIMYAC